MEIQDSRGAKSYANSIETSDIRQNVKQLEPSQAYKTLGVWLAADGNRTKELKILKDTAKEWADRIRVSFPSESESAIALYARIPSPLYVLITRRMR